MPYSVVCLGEKGEGNAVIEVACERLQCLVRRRASCAAIVIGLIVPRPVSLPAQPPPPPPSPIHGFVESPTLASFKIEPPASQYGFGFFGWVNFSGANGHIEMDALRFGNGSGEDPRSWELIESFKPDTTPRAFIHGENQYNWSVFPNSPFAQHRWPDGGTARFRFRAIPNPGSGFSETSLQLPILDFQGVQGRIPELIFSDEDPTPATAPSGLQFKPLFLTAGFLTTKPNLNAAATLNYYQNIGTDQYGSGLSIAESLSTLKDFKNWYFDGSGPEVTATYYNRGDLGLGREMHCIYKSSTKETACYVRNFGKKEGKPGFGDMPETLLAINLNQPFATVAMVERGKMEFDAPNKVFFVVYLSKNDPPCPGELGCTAQLDNSQSNISIPTNCMVCHGSASTYQGPPREQKPPLVKHAYFLPFDLQSFDYYGKDPRNKRSRPAQESAFAKLNKIVDFTDLGFNPAAHELIQGWYSGSDNKFVDGFVPKMWKEDDNGNADPNAKQLYLQVVAPTCRTCHISYSPAASVTDASFPDSRSFSKFEDFYNSRFNILFLACKSHSELKSMPNAEQTSNNFWQSPARSHLLNRLELKTGGCGLNPFPPGALAITQLRRPALEVWQDYKTESCGCTTTECLKGVADKYVQEIPAMQFDPSAAGAIDTVISEAGKCYQQVLRSGFSPVKSEYELVLERDLARAKAFPQ